MYRIKHIIYITIIFLFYISSMYGQGSLSESWKKQIRPIKNKTVFATFTEGRNELEHSYQPWEKTFYQTNGSIRITPDSFYKKETISINGKDQSSLLQYDQKTMLFYDYGSDTLSIITTDQYKKQLSQTARYTPTLLLEYFNSRKTKSESSKDSLYTTYLESINGAKIRLFINKTTNLVDKINILENDDFMGDVSSTFVYHYINQQSALIPQEVSISKINGKLQDTIYLTSFRIENNIQSPLAIPAQYTLKERVSETHSITLEKYNEHIYFLYLPHTDSKSLIVNFKDFILVAEAPLNSENGDLIIKKIKNSFPNKPIKYFIAGHYHPHYLGGVRSFIHNETTVLSPMGDFDYVSFIAKNPHTLKSDSLQMDKKTIKIHILGDSRTITDDNYSMQIINIGEDSHHTKDYAIFYFPEEKVIFEGDLIWIPSDGRPTRKVSNRQRGLYEAIKKLNLQVETIFQSWPIKEFNYKSKISFKELEESIKN